MAVLCPGDGRESIPRGAGLRDPNPRDSSPPRSVFGNLPNLQADTCPRNKSQRTGGHVNSFGFRGGECGFLPVKTRALKSRIGRSKLHIHAPRRGRPLHHPGISQWSSAKNCWSEKPVGETACIFAPRCSILFKRSSRRFDRVGRSPLFCVDGAGSFRAGFKFG